MHLAVFHPGHRQHAAHLGLHGIVGQTIVGREKLARRGRGTELEKNHVLVGTPVVDDPQVLQVGVAGRRELQQVRGLVLGGHAKDAHHLRVGEGKNRLLRLCLFFEIAAGAGCGDALKEVDDPLGDFHKWVAGYEVETILLARAQLLGRPAIIFFLTNIGT
jgi:hypothetical protein